MKSARILLGAALAFAALGSVPAAAQMKKFAGWIAACDNARDCSAYSLERGSYHAYLRIARGGTPSADAVITLAIMTDEPYRIRIELDDPAAELFPKGPIAADAIEADGHVRIAREIAPAALVAALRKAKSLGIFHVEKPADRTDDKIDGIALDGLTRALAWMDERQNRVGTVTAFIKRGPKTAVAVPMPPPLPDVSTARPNSAPVPKHAPPRILARANPTCGKEQRDADLAKTMRLDENRLMYWFSCGAYSSSASQNYAFLIAPEDRPEAAAQPRFVIPASVVPFLARNELTKRKDSIFNAEFDSEKMTLTSFNALRGAGDCGEYTEWVWTGREFQMTELRKMPDCEGIPSSDWPALYRASRR